MLLYIKQQAQNCFYIFIKFCNTQRFKNKQVRALLDPPLISNSATIHLYLVLDSFVILA